MLRRLVMFALASWPLAGALAQGEEPRPHLKVSARELRRALEQRFPLRMSMQGVLQLEVSAPRLLLLPERNELGATLVVRASGPALERPQSGAADVLFGLRYERSDRSLRAHHMRLRDLRLPDTPPETTEMLQEFLRDFAGDFVGEIVLHRFAPEDLALADTMGFEPDQVTVVDDGIVIDFAPKPQAAR